MSSGDARHGRRDNGLVAAEYAAAGDVDPRVGEHLLDVLALDGIAAYLRPSADMHPVTRSSSLPARPTDRLYVDRAHLATARSYIARLDDVDDDVDDANDDSGVDDAWAQIVAGYDASGNDAQGSGAPGGGRRPWPDAEDLADSEGGQGSAAPGPVGRPWVRTKRAFPDINDGHTNEPSLLDGLDTFGADLPDEDDEGYTPPAPPPLPRPSLPTALAIAGIIGGLILFLRPDLLPVAENTALLAGITAIVAGFGALVWRLRPGGDEDDDSDPDDGARV